MWTIKSLSVCGAGVFCLNILFSLLNASLVQAAEPNLFVTHQVSTTNPAPGETLSYIIRYRCASMGSLYCAAPVLSSAIPTPLQVLSYTVEGGHVADANFASRTLTWALATPADHLPAGVPAGSLAAGSTGLLKVMVRFPSCGVATPLSSVTSSVTVASDGGTSVVSAPSVTVPAGINAACPTAPPPASAGFAKTGSAAFIQAGGLERWAVVLPSSSTAYTVTEQVPVGMSAYWAVASNVPTVMGHPEVDCTDNGVDDFHALNAPILSWASAEYDAGRGSNLLDAGGNPTGCVATRLPTGNTVSSIRRLRWSVPANSAAQSLDLRFVLARDYNSGSIRNCITSSLHGTACAADIPVLGAGSPILSISKITPSGGVVSPDGTTVVYNVTGWGPMVAPAPGSNDHLYRIAIGVDELSGVASQHLVLEDVLPATLDYLTDTGGNWWRVSVPNSLTAAEKAACGNPIFSRTLQADGRVKLRWDFAGCPSQPGSAAVYFSARIRPGVAAGTRITNTASLMAADFPLVACINGADAGKSGLAACRSSNVNFNVPELTNLDSAKWVKGLLDSNYHRFPEQGQTLPASAVLSGTYVLEISNTGNVTHTQMDAVDVLPAVGDTALLGGEARQSQWGAALAGVPELQHLALDGSATPVGAADLAWGIQYAATTTPCTLDAAGQISAERPVLFAPAGCSAAWDASASGARAFSFRWSPAKGLKPGETLRVTVPIREVAGEGSASNRSVAWNSFAYTAHYQDTSSNAVTALLSSEPPKVGLLQVDPAVTAGLGDRVWLDSNGNGLQDGVEPGLAGVTVRLYDGAAWFAETRTDAQGYYAFLGLLPEHAYTVKLDKADDYVVGNVLAGMQPTQAKMGGHGGLDSDALLQGGYPVVTVETGVAGSFADSHDLGLIQWAVLGDKVWFDQSSDGVQDADEAGVAGVSVSLRDVFGQTLATTTTNALGAYRFDGLRPGVYSLAFSQLPAGYVPTRPNTSGDAETDSDTDSQSNTAQITLMAGERALGWDMGLRPEMALAAQTAALAGRAWLDQNRNGVQDAGEVGVAAVKAVLLDADGFPLEAQLTDADGLYRFAGLLAGTYAVKFDLASLPAGHIATVRGATGTKDTADSDASVFTGETEMLVLAVGELDNSWDLGVMDGRVDLSLSKVLDKASARYGDTVTYTLTLNNAGPAPASGVVVQDVLPSGLRLLSSSPAGAYDPANGIWQVGDVPAQGTAVLRMQVEVGR